MSMTSDEQEEFRAIFNGHDLIGLCEDEDDSDAYDPEICLLWEQIDRCQDVKSTRNLLWEIFRTKFGSSAGTTDDYEGMAEAVMEWKELQGGRL
ncbi:MAG: hypothetical protein AAB320_06760 [Elusimicrobiota bacterium]